MGRFSVSIQKLPSGTSRAVVRHAGVKRNGEAHGTRREALADEARIRLEMGSGSDELDIAVDALLKDQIEQGAYAATTLDDLHPSRGGGSATRRRRKRKPAMTTLSGPMTSAPK